MKDYLLNLNHKIKEALVRLEKNRGKMPYSCQQR